MQEVKKSKTIEYTQFGHDKPYVLLVGDNSVHNRLFRESFKPEIKHLHRKALSAIDRNVSCFDYIFDPWKNKAMQVLAELFTPPNERLKIKTA
eukprot:Awhi_evm1s14454